MSDSMAAEEEPAHKKQKTKRAKDVKEQGEELEIKILKPGRDAVELAKQQNAAMLVKMEKAKQKQQRNDGQRRQNLDLIQRIKSCADSLLLKLPGRQSIAEDDVKGWVSDATKACQHFSNLLRDYRSKVTKMGRKYEAVSININALFETLNRQHMRIMRMEGVFVYKAIESNVDNIRDALSALETERTTLEDEIHEGSTQFPGQNTLHELIRTVNAAMKKKSPEQIQKEMDAEALENMQGKLGDYEAKSELANCAADLAQLAVNEAKADVERAEAKVKHWQGLQKDSTPNTLEKDLLALKEQEAHWETEVSKRKNQWSMVMTKNQEKVAEVELKMEEKKWNAAVEEDVKSFFVFLIEKPRPTDALKLAKEIAKCRQSYSGHSPADQVLFVEYDKTNITKSQTGTWSIIVEGLELKPSDAGGDSGLDGAIERARKVVLEESSKASSAESRYRLRTYVFCMPQTTPETLLGYSWFCNRPLVQNINGLHGDAVGIHGVAVSGNSFAMWLWPVGKACDNVNQWKQLAKAANGGSEEIQGKPAVKTKGVSQADIIAGFVKDSTRWNPMTECDEMNRKVKVFQDRGLAVAERQVASMERMGQMFKSMSQSSRPGKHFFEDLKVNLARQVEASLTEEQDLLSDLRCRQLQAQAEAIQTSKRKAEIDNKIARIQREIKEQEELLKQPPKTIPVREFVGVRDLEGLFNALVAFKDVVNESGRLVEPLESLGAVSIPVVQRFKELANCVETEVHFQIMTTFVWEEYKKGGIKEIDPHSNNVMGNWKALVQEICKDCKPELHELQAFCETLSLSDFTFNAVLAQSGDGQRKKLEERDDGHQAKLEKELGELAEFQNDKPPEVEKKVRAKYQKLWKKMLPAVSQSVTAVCSRIIVREGFEIFHDNIRQLREIYDIDTKPCITNVEAAAKKIGM